MRRHSEIKTLTHLTVEGLLGSDAVGLRREDWAKLARDDTILEVFDPVTGDKKFIGSPEILGLRMASGRVLYLWAGAQSLHFMVEFNSTSLPFEDW